MDKGDEQHEKAEEGVQGEAGQEHEERGAEAGQGESQAAEKSDSSESGMCGEDGSARSRKAEEEEEAQIGAPDVVGTTVSEKFMRYEPKSLDPGKLVESAVQVADAIRKQEQFQALKKADHALRLVREDFDTMENDYSAAYSRTEVGVFVDDDRDGTAWKKIGDYLRRMDAVQVYLAWDGNIYPRFSIEEVVLR